MKKFAMSVLGLTVALGTVLPTTAQTVESTPTSTPESTPTSMDSSAGQSLIGKVTTEQGPEVTVQFPNNMQRKYSLDPGVVKALNLTSGSTVMVSNRRLGTIVNADRQKVWVEFADGTTEPYYQTRESRRTLGFGDSVVVTPSSRVLPAANYFMTAADVQVSPSMLASTPVTPDATSPSTPGSTTPGSSALPSTSPTASPDPALPGKRVSPTDPKSPSPDNAPYPNGLSQPDPGSTTPSTTSPTDPSSPTTTPSK
jgi:hypothetical protein